MRSVEFSEKSSPFFVAMVRLSASTAAELVEKAKNSRCTIVTGKGGSRAA